MENSIIDFILNLFYHIITKIEGGNTVQVFVFTNFCWVIGVFFLSRKYHKLFETLIEIAENQNKILDQVDKHLLEQEYKQKLQKLIAENEQLKVNNKVNLELIKQIKKKK